MKHTTELQEKDRNSVLHPFTNLQQMQDKEIDPKVIKTGKGVYIYDEDNTKYLDAFAGLYCMNLGYGRSEIAEAIYAQAKELSYYHSYVGHTNESLAKLSDRLIKMLPSGMSKIFYGQSGSDANESHVKNIWYYHNLIGKPKKKRLIATLRGYHGCSVMSGSLTGMPFYHEFMDLPLSSIIRFEGPNYYSGHHEGESELEFSKRRAKELDELILQNDPETIGGFFAEPVQGTGGIVPPPEGYFPAVQEVLQKYDILLVADEVVTGFGRTGSMFGSEKYQIKPDMMTLAKGLTSAYAPLSAAVINQKMSEVFYEGAKQVGAYSHGYTYSGHPLGTAAANAVLDIIEKESIVDQVNQEGEYFKQQLQAAFTDHPNVGDVRAVGLLGALEFSENKQTRTGFSTPIAPKVAAGMLKRGVIVRAMPNADILGISPPLIISKEEVKIVVQTAVEVMEELTESL